MFQKLAEVSPDQALEVRKAYLLTVQPSDRLSQGSRWQICHSLQVPQFTQNPPPPSQPIAQFLQITMPQEAFPSKIGSHSSSSNIEEF